MRISLSAWAPARETPLKENMTTARIESSLIAETFSFNLLNISSSPANSYENAGSSFRGWNGVLDPSYRRRPVSRLGRGIATPGFRLSPE
jgi:hypothetical protein